MTERTQQEFLQAAKDAFGCTWDELAKISGIKPRALKTYRMPAGSKDFRTLNSLAKDAIDRALKDHKKVLK